MFPAPPRPVERTASVGPREREREPEMLPRPPLPEECYDADCINAAAHEI
jgi:hypothetical protein